MNSVSYKFGRTERQFNPRIPHYSSLVAGKRLPTIPVAWDWAAQADMPADLDAMRNDALGNCTCAAIYHARQVWTANMGTMITEPDIDVELLYHHACGWNPSQSGEGPGGNVQSVLTFLLRIGAPTGSFGASAERISACGIAYIGFHAPAVLRPPNLRPPAVWQVDSSDHKIIGGHAAILVGYNAHFAKIISWGRYYKMTWQFFSTYVDEVYAMADEGWFSTKEQAQVMGVSLRDLEWQMQGLCSQGTLK